MTIIMPPPIELGHSFPGTLRRVMLQRSEFDLEFDNPTGLRTVMGFALPEWQRGLVWTDEQKVKFVESAWLGLPLGTYTVNTLREFGPLNNLLIDGQQRMSAIQAYLDDEIEVFGARWSDVDADDKRRFAGMKFGVYETHSNDEAYLRSYYDLMNFGGTAHAPAERASLEEPGM